MGLLSSVLSWYAMCLSAMSGSTPESSAALMMISSVEKPRSMITTDSTSTPTILLQVNKCRLWSLLLLNYFTEVCQQQDPGNPLCQVSGRYSLRLDSRPGVAPRWWFWAQNDFNWIIHRYNYVPVKPGLLESCPSMAPDYLASPEC